jgi:L,D-transpeptidase YcbB
MKVNPNAVVRRQEFPDMDSTCYGQFAVRLMPVLLCRQAGVPVIVSRVSAPRTLSLKWQASRAVIAGLCMVLLQAAPAWAASQTELEAAQSVRKAKAELESRQSWIWFDEQGPKVITAQMLTLAQDLGLGQVKGSRESAATLMSKRELDDSYSEIFIEMLGEITRRRGDEVALTTEALRQANVDGRLTLLVEDIVPRHERATRLRRKMWDYRQLTAYVWPSLSETRFRLGQRAPEIAKLRWMLTQLGDLPPKQLSGYRDAIFDPSITAGIKHLQRRHGLPVTGELNEMTRQALNMTPAERINLMRRTLLRWVELPAHLPRSYLWINLPSYRLDVIEGESSVLNMRVIVGKPGTPTPLLTTELTQITVNPSWTPPASIIYGELLPKNSEEPGYLASMGFELRKFAAGESPTLDPDLLSRQQLTQLLREYQLVQRPGGSNALGYLRFSIPNTDAIYLHDTPVKSLFKEEYRALSHGCVRLENAKGLLNYLLSVQASPQASSIQTAMEQASPRHFRLPHPLPVIMTYHTVWVDDAGLLQFRPDVYQLN